MGDPCSLPITITHASLGRYLPVRDPLRHSQPHLGAARMWQRVL